MRHGTTIWNEKGITQGRTQNRLSKSGVELTKQVAIEYKNCKFEAIISSPLMRTIQTANIMNKYQNVKIIKDDSLIEIDQGIFTGRYKNSLTDDEKKLRYNRDKSAKMESYEECFNRIKAFITTLKEKYHYNRILIITHNVCASFIEDILLSKDINFNNSEFLRNFKNAEVKKFVV